MKQLTSLQISNFKTFRDLRIETLGLVNLITGKNSVGKTSMLEALWLLCRNGSPESIGYILVARDEYYLPVSKTIGESRQNNSNPRNWLSQLNTIKNIFHGREEISDATLEIGIGSMSSNLPDRSPKEPRISLKIELFHAEVSENGDGTQNIRYIEIPPIQHRQTDMEFSPYVLIQINTAVQLRYKLETINQEYPIYILKGLPNIPSLFVGAHGLGTQAIGELWDQIQLTPLQDMVETALRIVYKNTQRVSLRADYEGVGRIPILKMNGTDEPVTLRSLGDGMSRLFGLVLSLVNSKDGILLIDEIENGFHFSIQNEIWQLIFELANKLNVQVFATTHSWDCVEAFQKAANAEASHNGMLIRLQEKNGEIKATTFSKDELEIATRNEIELR